MRRLPLLVLLALSIRSEPAMAQLPVETPSADSNFVSLFAGDTFAGWVVEHPTTDRARASQGVLLAAQGAGWVRTEQTSFGTFVLRFDARAAPDTRAVLALLGRSPRGRGAGTVYAIPLFGEAVPDPKAFSLMRLMVLPLTSTEILNVLRPNDDWQHYELMRRDDRIVATVNSKVTIDQNDQRTLDGWIGFHVQRGQIELRNVRLGSPTVYQAGPNVTLPRLLHEERPRYTDDAMRAKIQGAVLLECVVEPDGKIGKVLVIRSLDQQFGLDDEAIRTVRQWRFAPGTSGGKSVPVAVTVEISFALKK